MLLLIVIGIIPCIVVGQGIISNYEKRAVSVRTAEIQNQSTMLGSRLGKAGYLKGVPSETLMRNWHSLLIFTVAEFF